MAPGRGSLVVPVHAEHCSLLAMPTYTPTAGEAGKEMTTKH